MTKRKRKKIQSPQRILDLRIVCRGCVFFNRRTTRPMVYKGYLYDNGDIKSQGLTSHLNKIVGCSLYYHKNVFCRPDYATSRVDLYPDLIDWHPGKSTLDLYLGPRFKCSFTSNQLGLTRIGTCNDSNSRLDNQVMYDDVPVGTLSRKLIDTTLIRDCDESMVDFGCEDCDSVTMNSIDDLSIHNEDEANDFLVPEASFVSEDNVAEVPEDAMIDEPQSSLSISITTPSLCSQILCDKLVTEIKLLNILRRHKIPLCVHKELYDWAYEAQILRGFDWGYGGNPYRGRPKVIKSVKDDLLPHIKNDCFEEKLIPWLPEDKPQKITFRSFENALRSLLTNNDLVNETNLSFPNADSPYSCTRKPVLTTESPITELHHGSWWIDTWKNDCDCTTGSQEILVPLIFYTDGITVDAHGKHTLTPLNMTLGIFSTEARKRRDAWETLYFHPSKSAPDGVQNIQNLHNGIEAALESLLDIWKRKKSLFWDNLPWAGNRWKVSMKFAIAFIIGDTEMHDKLCGRFGNRTENVQKLCRHCDCPINWSHIPSKNTKEEIHLFIPEDVNRESNSRADLQLLSHHPIRNVFHTMNFGTNKNNIHLATPGEKLHMHQLGVAKRALQSYVSLFCPTKNSIMRSKMENLCSKYGSQLTRQSDRDFPRTRFSSEYLSIIKKEGNDYSGLILCLIISLLCTANPTPDKEKANAKNVVRSLELIIGMEEFLRNGSMKVRDVSKLPLIIANFLNEVNINCYKKDGMGQRIIKIHLYFHLQDYIELWGPPAGWDSSACEGHHKTEIKAPSKSTQCNKSTLIEQTANRQLEYRLIDRAITEYSILPVAKERTKGIASGSRFVITANDLKWDKKPKSRGGHAVEVLTFIRNSVLPILKDNSKVRGFTEHNRKNEFGDYKFRASPSYRSDGGQINSVWFDWCTCSFVVENQPFLIPCQLLCFLDIRELKPTPCGINHRINQYAIEDPGLYAVVRKFKEPPTKHPSSTIVSEGTIDTDFLLIHVDTIETPICVVRDHGSDNNYFVVGNRNKWLDAFTETTDSLSDDITDIHVSESGYEYKYPNPTKDKTVVAKEIIQD